MGRTKKRVFSNIKLEQAQDASRTFTANATRLAAIEARMNGEINKIKDKYQEEITELNNAQEEPTAILEAFASEQKTNWGKKKSFELLHSIIGFRTGMPKVTKDKRFTWEGITEIVKEKFPALVRSKDELDKEAIIALTKNEADFAKVKSKCYLDVVQDETFFVEAKKEDVAEVA